ncbi:MAG: hypothetical protein JSS00_13360 [Proteobacteria bacterium]|nr:hypothetical protein [Pseudomonadota bacterium]
MKRIILTAGIALTLLFAGAEGAQARIFEPQHNWWSSGRTCIASRNPPGLAWDDLPPRACVASDGIVSGKTQSLAFEGVKGQTWLLDADQFADKTLKA